MFRMQMARQTAGREKSTVGTWLLMIALALIAPLARTATGQAITPRIAAGGSFSAALSSHGVVWTWGSNSSGQLGYGIATGTPQPITGLSNIVDIACGSEHALVVTATGTVLAWGANSFGQLGLGHNTNQTSPQLLPTVTGAVRVSAGSTHSLVLLANGTVLAFGEGSDGRLGLGNINNYYIPMPVPGLSSVVAISAGSRHSGAVMANGALYVWGSNSASQLALTSGSSSPTPTLVAGVSAGTAVACGYECTLCLDAAGVLRQWGHAGSYNSAQPQVVVLTAPTLAIAAARTSRVQMALSTGGAVLTWGSENSCYGLMGTGSTGCSYVSTPAQAISMGSGIVAISFGSYHGMALTQSGSVNSWGYGGNSQLGYSPTGSNSTQPTPATIPGLDLNVFALYLVPVGSFTELRYFHGDPGSIYANMCTTAVQSPVPSGLLNVGGLWLTFADLLAWGTFIQAGYPMATGSIGALGTAVTTLPMPNSALAGITINAVSFNLLAGSITNTSPIVTHTF